MATVFCLTVKGISNVLTAEGCISATHEAFGCIRPTVQCMIAGEAAGAAAALAVREIILFCNVHPSEPGMVGMLAASGALDQLGRPQTRVWGKIEDKAVLAFLCNHIHGCYGDWTADRPGLHKTGERNAQYSF